MSSFESIRSLSTFRDCRDETVPRKTFGKILEAGRQAPSPRNIQSIEFVVVESGDILEDIAEVSDERVKKAPTSVVVVSDLERMERRLGEGAQVAANAEMAVAVQNMRLVASEEGIASIWLTGFDQAMVSDLLNLPDGKLATAIVSFAYTEDPVEKEPKYGMNEMTFYDMYGNQVGSVFDSMQWRGLEKESEIQKRKLRGIADEVRRRIRKVL